MVAANLMYLRKTCGSHYDFDSIFVTATSARDHFPFETNPVELVNLCLRHVLGGSHLELFVLGALRAHPPAQRGIVRELGRHVAITTLLLVGAKLVVLLVPRVLALALGPSKVDRPQQIRPEGCHAGLLGAFV